MPARLAPTSELLLDGDGRSAVTAQLSLEHNSTGAALRGYARTTEHTSYPLPAALARWPASPYGQTPPTGDSIKIVPAAAHRQTLVPFMDRTISYLKNARVHLVSPESAARPQPHALDMRPLLSFYVPL